MSRISYLKRVPRMVKALRYPGTASGRSRRQRAKSMARELACGLLTGRKCWQGKPYRQYEGGPLRRTCHICKATRVDHNDWPSKPPGPPPRVRPAPITQHDLDRAAQWARETGH